jgi:two-component system, LytTR family, response regulator
MKQPVPEWKLHWKINKLMKFTAIIIDDEKNSRDALHKKIQQYYPELEIIALCEDGTAGIEKIETLQPDIVFLDVEMPRINGFTMLQQLKNRDFELIFTTAYDHYAIQAIRFSALDYLIKPIEAEELVKAVTRAIEKRKAPVANQRIENLLHNFLNQKNSSSRIAIPSLEGLQFIEVDEIIYLEAKSNYTEIYLQQGPRITVSKTLKEFEELLPASSFIRIHHSHLINKNHVLKYLKGEGGQVVMRNGATLDVARRKKEEFMKAIGY